MSIPAISAIVFDHDGTLVNSEPVHLQIWQNLLPPGTLDASTYLQNLSGVPTSDSARWLVDRYQLNLDPERLLADKFAAVNAYLANSAYPLMPGALAMLDCARAKNLPLAVASGGVSNEVHHSLESYRIRDLFHAVVCGDEVVNNKPAPDVYQLAAEQLGVAAELCLAIEDSDSGQLSAYHAGMYCLRINHGNAAPLTKNCRQFDGLKSLTKWLNNNL